MSAQILKMSVYYHGDFMNSNILKYINDPHILIIDLRDEFSFRQLHLKNAINIPGDDLKSQIPYLPHDKLLYFICDTGKTAKKMAEQCQQLGFQCQYFPHSFQSLLILKNEQYF